MLEPDSLFNKNQYEFSNKMFESPTTDFSDQECEPLTEDEVDKLLDIVEDLKNIDVAQGHMKAYESIRNIHREGIPARLGKDSIANLELMGSMRFILFKVNSESDIEKKRALLLELAECLKDCVPVTQGQINLMHMKLASVGGFDKQIESFISYFKEKIVDQVIYNLHPEMENLQYAMENHNKPWLQFPHMRNGYLNLKGEELGLNMKGVAEDQNKNQSISEENKNKFVQFFREKCSIHDLIKEFIVDVNGRNGQIDMEGLMAWCIPENLGQDEAYGVYHDEDKQYPSYSPDYNEDYYPYLTEKSAYLIFEKLGFLNRVQEQSD